MPVQYTILIGFLSAVITATTTLIGVWLSNKGQKERLEIQIKNDIFLKDQQLAYDKEKTEIQIKNDNNLKKQDLKREKLEELFILVTNWSKESYFVNHDFINPDNIIDSVFDKTKETQDLHYITQIEMLLFLYFPELMDDYRKLKNLNKKLKSDFQEARLAFNQYKTDPKPIIKKIEPLNIDFPVPSEEAMLRFKRLTRSQANFLELIHEFQKKISQKETMNFL